MLLDNPLGDCFPEDCGSAFKPVPAIIATIEVSNINAVILLICDALAFLPLSWAENGNVYIPRKGKRLSRDRCHTSALVNWQPC